MTYAYGNCMWYGPAMIAGKAYVANPTRRKRVLRCPKCGGRLKRVPSELEFWERVGDRLRKWPWLGVLLLWGEGRCYGSYELLRAAYLHQQANGKVAA